MFTVETEGNYTKVVAMDTTGKFEDLEIYFEENGSVYFRQWAEDLKQFQVSILSYNQFLSLVSCLDATDGMFELKLQRVQVLNLRKKKAIEVNAYMPYGLKDLNIVAPFMKPSKQQPIQKYELLWAERTQKRSLTIKAWQHIDIKQSDGTVSFDVTESELLRVRAASFTLRRSTGHQSCTTDHTYL